MVPADEGPAPQQTARWLHAAEATHDVHHAAASTAGVSARDPGAKLLHTLPGSCLDSCAGSQNCKALSVMDALAAYDDSDDEQQSSEDEQKQQQPRDAAHAGGHALSAVGPAPRPAAAAAAVSSLPPPDFDDGAPEGGDARWVKTFGTVSAKPDGTRCRTAAAL